MNNYRSAGGYLYDGKYEKFGLYNINELRAIFFRLGINIDNEVTKWKGKLGLSYNKAGKKGFIAFDDHFSYDEIGFFSFNKTTLYRKDSRICAKEIGDNIYFSTNALARCFDLEISTIDLFGLHEQKELLLNIGINALKEAGKYTLRVVPIIGTGIDIYELFTGLDAFDGEQLSHLERTLSGASVIISLIPVAKVAVKGLTKTRKILKVGDEFIEVGYDLSKANGLNKSKLIKNTRKVNKVITKNVDDVVNVTAKYGDDFLKNGKINASVIEKNLFPNELVDKLEKLGWKKTLESGGKKSGNAIIMKDLVNGTKIRIHEFPSNNIPYFRVQNSSGNYLDALGNFPSNATKEEMRKLTHFYFKK